MALLPGHKSAYIPIPKIRDYSLNPGHEEGKHKAIVFRSALGLNQENHQWLIDKIREGLSESEAMEEESISFGKRYLVDLLIRNKDKEATVRTAWIVRNGESFPRLTSCYIV